MSNSYRLDLMRRLLLQQSDWSLTVMGQGSGQFNNGVGRLTICFSDLNVIEKSLLLEYEISEP